MNLHRYAMLLLAVTAPLLQMGCASYSTISEARPGTAKVFSGTRLDLKAIRGDSLPSKQFVTPPPAHPALDLPLSLAMDAVLFPLTFSAALFESLLE